jgi:hypothetical protein
MEKSEQEATEAMTEWQAQESEGFRMSLTELQQRSEKIDRQLRRATVDFFLVFLCVSVTLGAMAALAPTPLQIAGVVLSSTALAWLVSDVFTMRRGSRSARESGENSALEYHKHQLHSWLAFLQPARVWRRAALLTPGPMLFLASFAAAHPTLAPIIYVEIATLLLAIVSAIPLAARARAGLQRKLRSLEAQG